MRKLLGIVVLICLLISAAPAPAEGMMPFRVSREAEQDPVLQVVDILVDETADTLDIRPNETVTDLRLEQISWDHGMNIELLYEAPSLDTNQVIRIRTGLPAGLPGYRLTAMNGEGERILLYIEEQEDGTPVLLGAEDVEDRLPSGEFSFGDLADTVFTEAPGTAGWIMEMKIGADGSFGGSFRDVDSSETGDGYPKGTIYGGTFTGSLSDMEEFNGSTRLMTVLSVQLTGEEEQEEGYQIIETLPYGLEAGTEVFLFLPGTPVDDLPDEFAEMLNGEDGNTMTGYGLYFPDAEYGLLSTGSHGPVPDERTDDPEEPDQGEVVLRVLRDEGGDSVPEESEIPVKPGDVITLDRNSGLSVTVSDTDASGMTFVTNYPLSRTGRVEDNDYIYRLTAGVSLQLTDTGREGNGCRYTFSIAE